MAPTVAPAAHPPAPICARTRPFPVLARAVLKPLASLPICSPTPFVAPTRRVLTMRFRILALTAALFSTAPAWAIELADGKLLVDGSGGVAYGLTNHNNIQND